MTRQRRSFDPSFKLEVVRTINEHGLSISHVIKDSGLSDRQAAKVFGITRATAAKWLKRDDVQDRSHRAHTLHTSLSAVQEPIVLALRVPLSSPR